MSYGVSDVLMYSREVYLYYLRAYGDAFVGVHVLNAFLALVLPVLVWNPSFIGGWVSRYRHRGGSLILGYVWTWIAIGFHWTYFLPINYAAWAFLILFLLEAALFLVFGVLLGCIEYQMPFSGGASLAASGIRITGIAVYVFSLLGVPVMTWTWEGDLFHFGWTAEATVLGTMGLVLLVRNRWISYMLLPLPLLYALWSVVRAVEFGLVERYWLAAACVIVSGSQVAAHFVMETSGE